MKKYFKKISALLMAAIMVLTMCATVFAAAVSDKNTATITIEGLNTDETPTVRLYKVVKGNYSEQGFLGTYTNANGVAITDLNNPTEAEINAIAQGIAAGTISSYADGTSVEEVTAKVKGDTATATATGAGVYIALITGATKTVYNPLYIGVSYNKNSELSHDKISAGYLYANTAVAKKTSPKIEKDITGGIKADGDKATVSVGDVINYKLTPTVPSYPTNAVNKTFFVSDTMSSGLDFNFTSLTLAAAGYEVTPTANADNTVTYTINGTTVATAAKVGNGFNMNFSYDGLDSLNAEGIKGTIPALTVTYNARVNENAVVGGEGNTNDAEIYYSNTPNDGKTWDKVDEKPGKGNGIETKTDTKTVYSYQLALKKVDGVDANKVLAGAVFGIYEDAACTKLVDEITTNENGYAVSTAVAKGTYYVKELVAPTGYKLSTKVYPVDAQWTTATSTVTGETIRTSYTTEKDKSVDGKQVGWILNDKFYNMNNKPAGDDVKAAYVASTSSTTATDVSVVENKNGVVPTLVASPVPNTTLSQLPSTGGMGTYLFTIVGVVLMACAAGAFFMSRKKTQE